MLVGIIGGAGVAATNKLCKLIENRYTLNGAFRDAHHPEMIIYQATQAPSRSMFLEGRGPSFIEDYITVGSKLKSIGAEILCMNCNTAHYAIDDIQRGVGLPFINLIEEVVKRCKSIGKTNIGLVASDGCLMGKVYERYFSKIIPNANIIYPDDEVQKLVTKGICNIKNIHRFDTVSSQERPRNIFEKVREHLADKGSETIVIGCTDIRVDYHSNRADVIDSLEVLADAIVNLNDIKI
ncbi:MAG TPA: amino acid racemase [Salinivirgaceae bacterium]|nr:amino acid racemase [Salinivirgaceae bacterium]HQA76374.1 amino acid racemase [Salinivirgaceae bacterium]